MADGDNGHQAIALGEKATPAEQARLSVQTRTQEGASLQPLIFWVATVADEAPAWWVPSRDDYLRKFWRTEPMLAGAIYSIEAKIRTLGWALDGPRRQVSRFQTVLAEAEFGSGWQQLIGKVMEDLLTMDRGAFVELLRATKGPEGPVLGLAHLDSARCFLTGDLREPVVYYDVRSGQPHRLAAHQVLHLVSMSSPDEQMRGVGFSATSRVLRAAQIMRDIWVYRREKLSSRPPRGLLAVKGISKRLLDEAIAQSEEQMDNQGLTRFAKIITLAAQDPGVPLELEQIDFASLPDHYDEQTSTTLYAYTLALCLGVDARELWPATASGATKADALVQAMKARGKGFGDLLTTIEQRLNWAVLPRSLTFHFDFQDDEEDAQRAELLDRKVRTVVSLYNMTSAGLEGLVTRAEARQLLAAMEVLPQEMLAAEGDITPDVTGDEVEQVDTPAEAAAVAAQSVPAGGEAAGAEAEAEAQKDLARLFGPPVRYRSHTGRSSPLSVARPFASARPLQAPLAPGRKAKAGPRTVDLLLPAETDARLEEQEAALATAAEAGLAAVRKLVEARLRGVADVGAKEEPVPFFEDAAIWSEAGGALRDALLPEIVAAAQAGVQIAADALGGVAVGVDLALVNEPVLRWSRQYTYDLVSGLMGTTRAALREAIATWQEQGLGRRGFPDLLKALAPLFDRRRAELIASTEVTRAFAEGNYLVYRQVPGLDTKVWLTLEDERVCPRCGPLHEVAVGLEEEFPDAVQPTKLPPLHPRCRCRIVARMTTGGAEGG